MNSYQRIFGAGPRGLLASLVLLALARGLEPVLDTPEITSSVTVRRVVFSLAATGSLFLIVWSVASLPGPERGRRLVTAGAFRYFRHPLYAAFLSCFNFGLAVLLNRWIYVAWAVVVHVMWHWNVVSEERLMMREFPGAYQDYCRRTGRFVPRLRAPRPGRSGGQAR